MAAGGMLLASLLGLQAAAIVPAAEVRLPGRDVRVGDVASLVALPDAVARDLADRVIARLPLGRNEASVSRAALAGLVRRAVPGLEVAPEGLEGMMVLRATEPPARPARDGRACFVLTRAVTAGTRLAAADAEPAPCRDERPAPGLAFDRRDLAVRASADLMQGTWLGRIRLADAPRVARGDALTLASRVGPVTIEREVVAVQPGRAGGRVFVMTADGEVLSAAVPSGPGEGGE